MKILQVLPGLTVGGPSYTVVEHTRSLVRCGNKVQLHLSNENLEGLYDIELQTYNIVRFPFLKQLGFAFGEYKNLQKECQDAQVIQTNSLWMYANFVTEFARRGTQAKSVIMPRGTLSEYALSISSWKKKLVTMIGQGVALKNADMFIATCEMEYEDIRKYGLKAPVAIIPNGIHIPEISTVQDKKKRIVFLSRIHQKKGVDILLDAWKKIEVNNNFSEWSLSIVGPITDYAKEMIKKSQELKCERVAFPGSMSGDEKFAYMAESSIFILPTHSENFGIAVAEALACGTPAICTTGAPWEGLEQNNCGKWIELSEENVKNSLIALMSMPKEELDKMGKNGIEWMKKDFSWDEIGRKTTLAFEWLCDKVNHKCPDFIKID